MAQVHRVEVENEKTIVRTTPLASEMEAVAEQQGSQNDGFTYGKFLDMDTRPTSIMRGLIEPGGVLGTHEGDGSYSLYVVSGHGTLINSDHKGTETSRVDYQPGDLIHFAPKTPHKFENGSEPFLFIGVQQAPMS